MCVCSASLFAVAGTPTVADASSKKPDWSRSSAFHYLLLVFAPYAEIGVLWSQKAFSTRKRLVLTVLAAIWTVAMFMLLDRASSGLQSMTAMKRASGVDLVTTYNDDGSLDVVMTNRTGRALKNASVVGEWHFNGASKPVIRIVKEFGDVASGASMKVSHQDWAAPAFASFAAPAFNDFGLYEQVISRSEKARRYAEYQKASESMLEARAKMSYQLDQVHPVWHLESADLVGSLTPQERKGAPVREQRQRVLVAETEQALLRRRQPSAEVSDRSEMDRRSQLTMEQIVRLGNAWAREPNLKLNTVSDQWQRPIAHTFDGKRHVIASAGADGVVDDWNSQAASRSDDIVYVISAKRIGFVVTPMPEVAEGIVARLNEVRASDVGTSR